MAQGRPQSLVSKAALTILFCPSLSTHFPSALEKISSGAQQTFDERLIPPYFPSAMHNNTATLPFAPDAPWLAPLAGYSDLPFRTLCRTYGAACTVTEMVSVKGLVYGGFGTERLLFTTPQDSPLVVQLFGAEPEIFERAMPLLLERGFTHFDLNAGCSVRKVNKSGSGSALMSRPALLLKIAETMVRAAGPGKVGVKMRLGFTPDEENYLEVGRELEDLGVGWLTLHPRTAKQLFGGTARWESIGELSRAVGIPVLASGDLFTAEAAASCLSVSGCAGVMFARGALTDPMIFQRLKDILAGRESAPRTAESLAEAALTHIRLCRELDPTPRAFRALRAFLPRYAKGFSGIRALRQALLTCHNWEELTAMAGSIAHLAAEAVPLDHSDMAQDCGA
jgi:tRNA-dihydrouridine synthase B